MMIQVAYDAYCNILKLRLNNNDLVELAAKIMSIRTLEEKDIEHYFDYQYKENTELMRKYFNK